MEPTDEIRETFFQECQELLEALIDGLQSMQDQTGDSETIHGIFRAVHSIKGGAGAFGFDHLVRFAHDFETVLDATRNDRLVIDDGVMAVFQRANDMLGDLIQAAYENTEVDSDRTDQLIGELNGLLPGSGEPDQPDAGEPDMLEFQPLAIAFDLGSDAESEMIEDQSLPGGQSDFTIRFKPFSLLYRNGNETALIFRALAGLGSLEVVCDTTAIPDFDALDPEESYLSWVLYLTTPDSETAVHDVFEFAEGDCSLEITPGRAVANDETDDCQPIDQTAIPGWSDALEPVTTDANPAEEPDDSAPVDADQTAAPAKDPDPIETPEPAKQAFTDRRASSRGPTASVRVDVTRVDRLINLVGELVMNQAMLSQCISEEGGTSLADFAAGLDELKQLSREIQDGVMAIRTQPVKPLFQRMFRIVREAAAATQKTVRLEVSGDTTEVDKTVIEKLADPLTHMIRNAVDHGLEAPVERESSGKPREGVIRLAAAHRSGRVIIDITDDGAGIDRDRVRQIALDKGLIAADDQLTPEETDALLFRPGFSTAKEVSNLSGRGVGLDVVKNAIQILSGRISITSSPGEGSTFSISLPLTLAVLDGMVVEVSGQRMVIPISTIVETILPDMNGIHPLGSSNVVSVRNGIVSVVDVAHALGFRERLSGLEAHILILVENDDGARCALCVDNILDQRQVVIKGLEENYGHVPGVAAATILGDGGIALILDLDDELFNGGQPSETARETVAKTG